MDIVNQFIEIKEQLYISDFGEPQVYNQSSIDSLLNTIFNKYRTLTTINIKRVEGGFWEITFFNNSNKIIVLIDVNIGKNSFPRARIISPKFAFLGQGNILWNGIIVANGLTSKTWNRENFVDIIGSTLPDLQPIIGLKYEDVAIDTGFQRLNLPSNSNFSPLKLKHRTHTTETESKDEVMISKRVYDYIQDQISSSQVWFLEDQNLYFELETEMGLKIIAKLSHETHLTNDDIILVPEALSRNLLLLDIEDNISLRLVRVPVAKTITLWIPDPVFRGLPNTKAKIERNILEYTTFTSGTVITIYDDEFGKDRDIVVVEVTSWEPNDQLRIQTVTTVVPSNASVEMLILYDETESEILYSNVDPLDIYRDLIRPTK